MIAAIIFLCSTAGTCQFGLFFWRAMIANVAAQPVSDRVWHAIRIAPDGTTAHDFRAIVSVANMSPALCTSRSNFTAIRAYYTAVEILGQLLPPVANWSESEMATCSRYVAAILDQRLEGNVACAAETRAY